MRESAASHCSRASWRAIRCFSHCAHAVTSPSAFDKKKTTKRSASTNTPRRTRRAISPPSSARAGDSPAKQRAIKPIRRRIGDNKFKRNKNDNGRGKRIVPFHRPLRATGFVWLVVTAFPGCGRICPDGRGGNKAWRDARRRGGSP